MPAPMRQWPRRTGMQCSHEIGSGETEGRSCPTIMAMRTVTETQTVQTKIEVTMLTKVAYAAGPAPACPQGYR